MVEYTLMEWQEGARRLAATSDALRRPRQRVCDALVAELRRRLGGRFTLSELAELYESGTDWCLDLAIATEPRHPEAWDASVVCDAAFWRYAHEAADFAGGRQRN